MIDYRMPALGADMEAGTLVEWLVKPGDKVKSGSIIAVVETQKGAIEIEVFHEGTIAEITVPIGQRVPVGTILAHIDDGTPPSPLPPVQVEIPAPVGKTAQINGRNNRAACSSSVIVRMDRGGWSPPQDYPRRAPSRRRARCRSA